MKFRYLVSYMYNDKDYGFGCNTMEHVRDIVKALNVNNVSVYDYQFEMFRDISR